MLFYLTLSFFIIVASKICNFLSFVIYIIACLCCLILLEIKMTISKFINVSFYKTVA